jgi:DNA-directed RNA polymerase specialized sigma subunit
MTVKKTSKAPAKEKPKKRKNYLNKRDMLAALRRCHEADEMTPEFAKMITLLADRYGSKFEYADYAPHIDDMKGVAVMNVVRAWRSFDLEKYDNPFAYFTQAIKHTFWQYVHQEKKHRLNRDHLLINNGELPSDAFIDDIEKATTKEKMDDLLSDVDKEMEDVWKAEYKKRIVQTLPEHMKPSEVVNINIEDYEAMVAQRDGDSSLHPSGNIHSDVAEGGEFDTGSKV